MAQIARRIRITCLVALLSFSVGTPSARAIELLPGDLLLTLKSGEIVRMDASSGETEPVYQGELLARAGIVLDKRQNVFFTAVSNGPPPLYTVVRVDPRTGDSVVVSADGNLGPPAYDLAVGPDGLIYVAGGLAGIVRIDPESGAQEILAAPPAIITAFGIAFDGDDRLWIAEFAPGAQGVQLARIDSQTGQQLAVHTLDSCIASRNGRLVAANGADIFVNCSAESSYPLGSEPSSILRVNGDTGATSVVTSGGLLNDPYGIAVEEDGDVVVAAFEDIVRVAAASGNQSLVATVMATGVAVVRAACDDGLDNDDDGLIDFPDDPECTEALDLGERENPCGDRRDNDGDGLIDFPDDPGCRDSRTTTESPSCEDGADNDLDGLADLADPECSAPGDRLERTLAPGDIVVVDGASRALIRVDPFSGLQESLGELGYLETPTAAVLAPDRSLLVADPGAAAVVRIDSEGEQWIVASQGQLLAPRDLAVEPLGDLLVADEGALAVVAIDASSGSQQIVSQLASAPASIALESGGEILTAQPDLNQILRIDPSNGSQQVAALVADLQGIAIGPSGELVIMTGPPGSLISVDPGTGYQTQIASDLGALGGVVATPDGEVLATDVGEARVVRVPLAGGMPEVVTEQGFLTDPRGLLVVVPSCSDQLDNDGDGDVDHPDDAGCDDAADDSERSPSLVCDDGVDNDGDSFDDFPSDPGCDDVLDPSERSPSLVCDDGVDNDGDSFNDFPSDPGCDDPLDADERSPDLGCDDGLDNDSDGVTDFPSDPGCEGPASPVENPACQDGEDDDDDSLVDFPDDPGCDAPFDTDENSALLPCDDGLDNDGDRLTDSGEDPGCADVFDSSEREASLPCDDGLDNDGDGLIDFPQDTGCVSVYDSSETETSLPCDDGLDNDGDGLIDHTQDPGCQDPGDDSERDAALFCDDDLDNDGDGFVDFPQDPGCLDPSWPVENPACSDGADNEGDGLTDFPADSGCSAPYDLTETDGTPRCSNGVDDDGDGLVDHPGDPGCDDPLDESERGPGLPCDDGLDDDGDGARDYPGDPGCDSAADASEVGSPGVSPACDDGADNDGDSLADFPADPGCEGPDDAAESNPNVACDDGADNDTDGLVDFPNDPDCATPGDVTEGVVADSTPPVLASLLVAAGEQGATVTWTADEPARARVDYGAGQSAVNPTWGTNQVVRIEGLACGKTYLVAASSEDPAGNVGTAERGVVFTTLPCGAGRGLRARWRFEEGGGAQTSDASGGGNTGTLLGPSWRADTADGSEFSLAFDGGDDLVDVGTLDVDGQGLSIAVWAKADQFTGPGGDGRLVSKGLSIQEDGHFWMLSTFATANGPRLRFRVRTDAVTDTLVASSGDVPVDRWFHAAAVYDGSEMRLYLDGREVGRHSKQGALDTDPGVRVAIGNQPVGAGSKPFDGLLDDAHIYDRALTAAEIVGLYGNQATPISGVLAIPSWNGAVIQWTTDQASTTSIAYGSTPAYGDDALTHPFFEREHRVYLAGLAPESLYHYRISSTTEGGITSTWEGSFTTLPTPPVPALPPLSLGLLASALALAGARETRRSRTRAEH